MGPELVGDSASANLIFEDDEEYSSEEFDQTSGDSQEDVEANDVTEEEFEEALETLADNDIEVSYHGPVIIGLN